MDTILINFALLCVSLVCLLAILGLLLIRRSIHPSEASNLYPGIKPTALDEAQLKSFAIIDSALKQANRLLAVSELEGVDIVAHHKHATEKMTQEFQARLDTLATGVKTAVDGNMKQSSEALEQFIKQLEQDLANHTHENQAIMEKKIATYLTDAQTHLTASIAAIEKKMQGQLDQELNQAHTVIAEYKRRRLETIDNNIVEIVEKTINLTLGKQLPAATQMELVFKALNEAKKEHLLD